MDAVAERRIFEELRAMKFKRQIVVIEEGRRLSQRHGIRGERETPTMEKKIG